MLFTRNWALYSLATLLAVLLFVDVLHADDTSTSKDIDGIEFFERKIRPVLIEHCYRCHSREQLKAKPAKGDLLLDTREALLRGGESGPAIVPGEAGASLLVHALRYESLKMPPKSKLPDSVIADFVRWIDIGAPDPRSGDSQVETTSVDLKATRDYWAFRSPQLRPAPRVKNSSWPATEADLFILAALEDAGLEPTPPASERTWFRRVTYDLTGLRPTRGEVEAFLRDTTTRAREKVVDQLLMSPHFGVRWGRHWLDNVRYAQDDPTCCATNSDNVTAEPYRDWVVKAFNQDLPYDRFVEMQIAGDLLPQKDPENLNVDALTATGIWGLAHLPNEVEPEKVLADFVDDQLDVLGRTFLGLTLSCARCHDHKFDPISQDEYYALAGIFHSSHIVKFYGVRRKSRTLRPLVPTQTEERRYEERRERITALASQLEKLEKEHAERYPKALELIKTTHELELLLTRKPMREAARRRHAGNVQKLRDAKKRLSNDRNKNGWDAHPAELKDYDTVWVERRCLEKELSVYALRMVMRDGPAPGTPFELGDMPIYIRGNHRAPGRLAVRRVPSALTWREEPPIAERTRGSGRAELARWLTEPEHPLTSRVIVNRVWQQLFGMGLVRTASNFGRLGALPTHPELLDHLAVRFVANGWSVKKLLRELVLSKTYGQSSRTTPEATELDPENRLLSRARRRRLDGESLYDALNDLAGQITREVAPSQVDSSGRALYMRISRTSTDPLLSLFDGSDAREVTAQRADSTSAPQSLFLLNNPRVLEAAASVANQVISATTDDTDRIRLAYESLYGRPPSDHEKRTTRALVEQTYGVRRASKRLDADAPNTQELQLQVWTDFCHVLICSNEFLYID